MRTILFCLLLLILVPSLAQTRQTFSVHFDFNQFALTGPAQACLDSFIEADKALQGNKRSIELDGHCDFVGNDMYNDKLSDERVGTVKDYLFKNNLPAGIFTSEKGHGKRMPLNDNITPKERFMNRRVEITVIRAAGTAVKQVTAADLQTPPAVTPEQALEGKILKQKIEDTATKAGTNLVLKSINFIGARHQLLPQSYPALEELLQIMKDNKTLKIEVEGHVCCVPGNVDGIDIETGKADLSITRARAIMDYLTEHGIETDRVFYKGMGHSVPIYVYPEKSPMEQMTNRRVEIKIISK